MRGLKTRRFGTFSGGIDLPDDKGSTLTETITALEQPAHISLPMGRNDKSAGKALVKKGQAVKAGEPLAAGPDESPDVFAPADATVTDLSTIEVAGRYSMRKVPAVDLELTSNIEFPKADLVDTPWREIDDATLWDRITEGQLTVHRPGAVPLAKWVLQARARSCDLLVANAMEQQPLVTANHRLLVDYGPEVVEGLAILARAAGIASATLVVPRRRTD
ncbi:MAG: hypothetical protein QGG25_04170, partial [Phycisphaerae bacterium]|nr:hypothetical protein [Phycisphaerae bacterium]